MALDSATEIYECRKGSPDEVRECELKKGRELMREKGSDLHRRSYEDEEISDETADLGAFALETIANTEHKLEDVEEVTRDIAGSEVRQGVQQLIFKDGKKYLLKSDNDRSVAYTKQARHVTEKLDDNSVEVLNLRCNSEDIHGYDDCRMALTYAGKSTAATGLRQPLEEMDERNRERTERFLANNHEMGRKVVTQAVLGEFDRTSGIGKKGETITSFDFEMQAKNITLARQRLDSEKENEEEFYSQDDFTTFYDGGTGKIIEALDNCGGLDNLVSVDADASCNVANRDFNENFKLALEDSLEKARGLVEGEMEEGVAPTVLDPNAHIRVEKLEDIVEGGTTEIQDRKHVSRY